jgi:hypothetical protein
MNIKVISRSDEALETRDYRDCFEIEIDGKTAFSAYDGEPEDNSLGRNFSSVYSIPNLMQRAYEAGKNGEEFEITNTHWGDDF